MSNRAARSKLPEKRVSKVALAFGVFVIALAVLAYPIYEHFGAGRAGPEWISVPARVMDLRIALALCDPAHPSSLVQYRLEARMDFNQGGVQRDVWLPASEITWDQNALQTKYAGKKNTMARVRWDPHNPAAMEAMLN